MQPEGETDAEETVAAAGVKLSHEELSRLDALGDRVAGDRYPNMSTIGR